MSDKDWTPVCLEGGRLSPDEVTNLERALETAPDDVRSRVALLGYYFLKRTPEALECRNHHIFWFIENHPDVQLQAFGDIHQGLSPDGYAKAKQLWTEVIRTRGDDVAVLRRASEFFTTEDAALAQDLLRRGQRLEPTAAYWRDRLAHLFLLAASSADSSEAREQAARDALAECEAALELETSPVRRYCLMIDAATAAFLTKDYRRATEYAERVRANASEFQGTWVYGNGIHYGHIILGRVALTNDDVTGARDHLAAAAATPGSPQLNSFGPDQDLAGELLARGERDAVVAYTEACKRFYSAGLGMLGARLEKPL